MSSPIRSTPRNAGAPPQMSTTARALGDEALVAAMRIGDEGALREFLLRFQPLLVHHAGRLGVADGEEMAIEVLEDAALRLIASTAPKPKSLAAYLVASLRNRHLNARRAALRGEQLLGDGSEYRLAAVDAGSALLVSEGSLRYARGAPVDTIRPAAAIRRLSDALMHALTRDEHELMLWVSNHVAYREIAAWLGIGYAAVGKRVERLRARLRACGIAHVETLGADEREQLARFFHRAGLGADLRGAARSTPPPSPVPPPATSSGIDEDPAHVS